MKTTFSKAWKNSTQPRKQRKYRYWAPLHVRQKFMHVHLSSELRKKYGFRNVQIKTGDKVKVLRGQMSKKEGKVERVDLKRENIFITGLEKVKKEGAKFLVAFHPSNLVIVELDMEDKKRRKKIESKTKKELTKGEKDKTSATKEIPSTQKEKSTEKAKVIAKETGDKK